MSQKHQLGDLQLAIMRELWTRGEASVADVHAALAESRGLAPTTIATMLKKMEKKGVVRHRVVDRRFLYRPQVSEPDVIRAAVDEVAGRHFDGRITSLVTHLLNERDIDADELAELEAMIDAAKKERSDV